MGRHPHSVTGPDGRFSLDGVVGGRWMLWVYSVEGKPAGFDSVHVPIEVESGGVTALGAVPLVRQRVGKDEREGFLGLSVRDAYNSRTTLDLEVTSVGGPAEAAGIKIGDVVVSVDGYDVRGQRRYLYSSLVAVPEGRSLKIGLARGVTVPVVAPVEGFESD